MEFMRAVMAMKEGKEVRRDGWKNKEFKLKKMGDGRIGWTGMNIKKKLNDSEYRLHIYDYESNDWILFKEDKSLSDKIIEMDEITEPENHLLVCDVKKALKGYIKAKKCSDLSDERLEEIYFGRKLTS